MSSNLITSTIFNLDFYMNIQEIISNRPRDTKKKEYLDFWIPLSEKLEKFLGEGYKVIGLDPDFQVSYAYTVADLGIRKTYTFNVPLEIVLKLP